MNDNELLKMKMNKEGSILLYMNGQSRLDEEIFLSQLPFFKQKHYFFILMQPYSFQKYKK